MVLVPLQSNPLLPGMGKAGMSEMGLHACHHLAACKLTVPRPFSESLRAHAANLLQWEKLRKTGALPHLARWYDYVMTDPVLNSVAERYGPKKPTTRKEYVKVVAAAGMGGGGAPHPEVPHTRSDVL